MAQKNKPARNGERKFRTTRSGKKLVLVSAWIPNDTDSRYHDTANSQDKSKARLISETLVEHQP